MILKCHTLIAAALTLAKGTNAFSLSAFHPRNNCNELKLPSTRNALQSRTFARMPSYHMGRSETLLLAKKGGNKRRRKDGGSNKKKSARGNAENKAPAKTDDETINFSDEDGAIELPGFDLVEDIDLPLASSGQMSSASLSVDLNDPDAVLQAMKLTNGALPSASTRDLLRSRNVELEQNFVVDNVTQKFPTLGEYTQKSKSSQKGGKEKGTVGKKAARAAARKDAAIKVEEVENSGFVAWLRTLPKVPALPFTNASVNDPTTGDLSPIKVSEVSQYIHELTGDIYITDPCVIAILT